MNSRSRITRFMQQQVVATRPQIAAALGLSLVSTNAAVASLEKEGVLTAGGLVSSGGGRPVREYHFNPHHGAVALITSTPEQHCTLLRFELLDLQGGVQESAEARFAQLHAESLDEWLDATARRHKLLCICLPPGMDVKIRNHLEQRYLCSVAELSLAQAMASRAEDTLTLILRKGQTPQAAMHRHGHIIPCSLLHLLPLPADWETLDYADHTLVEEMIARLLQLLTCILAPANIVLHGDFWNDRLISRVQFNLNTKLRGAAHPPQLQIAVISTRTLRQSLRDAAIRSPHEYQHISNILEGAPLLDKFPIGNSKNSLN